MITLILATDMARHAEIMDSFKEKMENFDYSNEEHMTLVSGSSSLWGAGERAPPPAQTGDRRAKGKRVTSPCSAVSVKPAFRVLALTGESPPSPQLDPLS